MPNFLVTPKSSKQKVRHRGSSPPVFTQLFCVDEKRQQSFGPRKLQVHHTMRRHGVRQCMPHHRICAEPRVRITWL